MGDIFRIKHRSGGKYFKPRTLEGGTKNDTPIVLYEGEGEDDEMNFTFEKKRDQWGYIKHVVTKKIIQPKGGKLDPRGKTPLVLHDDRHDGALFAHDVYNHRIVHLNECFAQPEDFNSNPSNDTRVFLNSKANNTCDFLFVSPQDDEEVHVYGESKLIGKWEILNMVRDPVAEHIDKIEIKIGNSSSENEVTKNVNSVLLETSGETGFWNFFKMAGKGSDSVEKMLEMASSSTWSKETTRTIEIRVKPGRTVVTWQYVFTFEHCETSTMFKSNLLADTTSETEEPEEPIIN